MGKKYTEKKKDEMLCRVFKLIADSHLGDKKMIRDYCGKVSFPRSLGDDVAGFVRSQYPDVYSKSEKDFKFKKRQEEEEL
jgi:hypothetical protein